MLSADGLVVFAGAALGVAVPVAAIRRIAAALFFALGIAVIVGALL